MAPVVEAYQAMRGASFLVAVTFAAEIGDVRRFDTPRELMSFLGLAQSSHRDSWPAGSSVTMPLKEALAAHGSPDHLQHNVTRNQASPQNVR